MAIVLFVAGLLPASAQTLVHHYDLTSVTPLTDLAGGNTLMADGGTFVAGGYRFGPGNEGLRLVLPNIAPDEYAIELTFSVDAVPLFGFHKIVDFDEGQNDAGFYVIPVGAPSFVIAYPITEDGASGIFQDGVSATVVITRAATGEVKVFVDADEQIAFDDSLLQVAVLGILGTTETLTFFEDDIFTTSETGAGVVSDIKIYDAPFDPSIPPTAMPPVTSNVTPNPNPASVNEIVVVSATITDSGTDASNIASADFEVREAGTTTVVLSGSSAGCPSPYLPCPDGTFDSTVEDVEFTIPAGSLTPGVYDVCVRGTDGDPSVGEYECTFLAVYDPNGGFVTGGGWIQSEPGFCAFNALCAGAAGKAQFGFVSKYQKGANIPTGQTQFKFKAGDFDFDSTEYDWLVVAGSKGQFKGSGTINGSGDFAFLLTATDSAVNGGPSEDQFRIKIWNKSTDTTVYDNGPNQPLGGGSIVIHK